MSILEIIAATMGVLSVWYARKNNVLVFPTGIVSVLIYVYITYSYQIYAEAGINIYYFFKANMHPLICSAGVAIVIVGF